MILVLPALAVIVGVIPFFIFRKSWISPLVTVVVYIAGYIFFIGEHDWVENLFASLSDVKLIISALVSFIIVWVIEGEKSPDEELGRK